jgi:hypothetical protein
MNQSLSVENSFQQNTFWSFATQYAALVTNDEKFVSEIAYMMVTLHRTGA